MGNKDDATKANLELDKRLTGGNSANRGDTEPATEAEKANQQIQEDFYHEREEDKSIPLNIYQQPKD